MTTSDPDATRASGQPPLDGRSPASFRDPSGFVFWKDGRVYREVARGYERHYRTLIGSGLHRALVDEGLIVAHEELDADAQRARDVLCVIAPEPIPFVSYPYEWCFSELRDAALATLDIQERALAHGMTLKDASAYNIQLRRARPVLIDTLSFEIYEEGTIWRPYRQFCEHFLAPLALMSLADARLGQLLRIHVDGIPLDLASALLPLRSWLGYSLLAHVHLHARAQRSLGARAPAPDGRRGISRRQLEGLMASLRRAVERLGWEPPATVWRDYEHTHSYGEAGAAHKAELVDAFLDLARPAAVWDLGANTGAYSRLASRRGIFTVAWDADPAAVERCYRRVRTEGDEHLLPLVTDLANPSPALGWANRERDAFSARANADAVMALALVHHLAIAGNVPFADIAAFFAELGEWLIVEMIPPGDPMATRLLDGRGAVHPYTVEAFEAGFATAYTMVRRELIRSTERTLYLMRRKPART